MAGVCVLESMIEYVGTRLQEMQVEPPTRAELLRHINRSQERVAQEVGLPEPADLNSCDDVGTPFDGAIPEYAEDLLTSFVMARIMKLRSDERFQIYDEDYRSLLRKAIGAAGEALRGTPLGGIIDGVRQELSINGVPVPDMQELLRRINAAQLEIARDLNIPQLYITGVPTTAPFLLPEGVRPDVLLQADVVGANTLVTCLSVAEANSRGIKWERENRPAHGVVDRSERWWNRGVGEYFIIYDPANPTASVYPVGFVGGENLRLLTLKWPTELDSDPLNTDPLSKDPFDGALPSFGPSLIRDYVAWQYLKSADSLRESSVPQMHYNRYRAERERAFNATGGLGVRYPLRAPVWEWRTGDVYVRAEVG